MTTVHPTLSDLAATSPFRHLSLGEREKLQDKLSIIHLPANRFLLQRGDTGDDVYFLARGKMKVSRFQAGKEIILAIITQGDLVGEIAALRGGQRTADVTALTACTLLCCSKDTFISLLSHGGELPRLLMTNLAERIHTTTNRIEDLALFDVTSRLVRLLSTMGTPTLRDGIEVQVVHNPPTHQVLASMIGSSRETVTRTLRELEGLQHVTLEENAIVVRRGLPQK